MRKCYLVVKDGLKRHVTIFSRFFFILVKFYFVQIPRFIHPSKQLAFFLFCIVSRLKVLGYQNSIHKTYSLASAHFYLHYSVQLSFASNN